MKKHFLHVKGTVRIKVSARSARLKFLSCGPVCIEQKGCTAKCCDAPTHPDGVRIHVTEEEVQAFRERRIGVKTDGDGFLLPKAGCRICPFKTDNHLCSLFQDPVRPFGCIVSPFALNKNDTLIVRNRYKLLPCYDAEQGEPAYRVFRSSLLEIFGEKETDTIVRHLDAGGGDVYSPVSDKVYRKLSSREEALHKGKQ